MCLELIRTEKSHIICRNDRATLLSSKFNCSVKIILLIGATRSLEFDVEPIGKPVQPTGQRSARIRLAPVKKRLPDIALSTTGKRDQSAGMIPNPVEPDSGSSEVLPLSIGLRKQPHQVLITGLILGQQTQLVVAFLIDRVDHVKVRADYELDA